jgi:hypothetical protein
MVMGSMVLLPVMAVFQPWIAFVSAFQIMRGLLALLILPLLVTYDLRSVGLQLAEGKGAPWWIGAGAALCGIASLVGQVRVWRGQAGQA